jgi:hypothetical protein
MSVRAAYEPGWADVLEDNAAVQETGRRLIGQLGACEASALAFCRLLERWARGEPEPATPGKRQAALRRAADRIETALAGLEGPLGRYLLELEADHAEGRSGTAPRRRGAAWSGSRSLNRAGVHASAIRVAQTYLELAVFVRALEGLADAARIRASLDRSSLWAGPSICARTCSPHARGPSRLGRVRD